MKRFWVWLNRVLARNNNPPPIVHEMKEVRNLDNGNVENISGKEINAGDPIVTMTRKPFTFGHLTNTDYLSQKHKKFNDSVLWWITAEGVSHGSFTDDDIVSPLRTAGNPITIERIWNDYKQSISYWSEICRVPVELILATIATETRGDPKARREEPGWTTDAETPHRVSVGLMQTLISTAIEAVGDNTIDAEWLEEPDNAIQAGAAYISDQEQKHGFDPPLVAAAYNAGGVYYNKGRQNRDNKFKLKCYPIGTDHHVVRFCEYFGDAMHVINGET